MTTDLDIELETWKNTPRAMGPKDLEAPASDLAQNNGDLAVLFLKAMLRLDDLTTGAAYLTTGGTPRIRTKKDTAIAEARLDALLGVIEDLPLHPLGGTKLGARQRLQAIIDNVRNVQDGVEGAP